MNADRSVYVANDASAGRPRASAMSPDVNPERARVASARLSTRQSKPIGKRCEQLPRFQSVEARERPPVTVHLDDHRDADARQSAPGEHRRADERVGGDDDLRARFAHLRADAKRQAKVKDDSVQLLRSRRRGEPKAVRPPRRRHLPQRRGCGSRASARRRPTSSPARVKAAAGSEPGQRRALVDASSSGRLDEERLELAVDRVARQCFDGRLGVRREPFP